MTKVGIIGFGKMGRIRAELLQESGRARVVAVADPGAEKPAPEGAEWLSPKGVLTDSRVEAVFICSPNVFNKPYTIAALEAGKHVFCEKPPAFTAAEVDEIREAEAASGKVLMYGFNHRHHESIAKIKEMVDSRAYGKVLWMRGRYGKSVDQSFYDDWRSSRDLAGGGILLDQGIHMLDLFLYMVGDFDDVQAYVSNLYWELDIEDNVFAMMRNSKTGVVASLHSTMTQWRHLFSLEIFCERGYYVLNGLKTSSESYGEEILSIAQNRTTAPAARWEDEERIHYTTNNSWRSEIDQFLDGVQNGAKIRIGNSTDARTLMNLVDRIYASDSQSPSHAVGAAGASVPSPTVAR